MTKVDKQIAACESYPAFVVADMWKQKRNPMLNVLTALVMVFMITVVVSGSFWLNDKYNYPYPNRQTILVKH